MDTGLAGRAAVVSGGSKGVGKGIARALAAEGVNLVLLARTEAAVQEAARQIAEEFGVTAIGIAADVSDTTSLRDAARQAAAHPAFATIHIIVNNAAGPIARMDRQIEWPDEEWHQAIDVKTIGALRLIREFMHLLPEDGTGRIINVAGASGLAVWNPALIHGINNAALIYATGFLAADMAPRQVTVNAIVPGLVGTEFRQEWAKKMGEAQGKSPEEALAEYCDQKGILLRRWATMEEVGDLAVFLASDRARYITGAKIPIDGGFSVNSR